MSENPKSENPIVKFLQQTIRDISKFPTKGIAVIATSDGEEIYTSYHNVPMKDKLIISGLVQQDATLDMLAANGYLVGDDEEDDDEEDDENTEEEE